MTTAMPISIFDLASLAEVHAAGFSHSGDGATRPEDDIVGSIRRKHLRILVVDDEDNFRTSLAFMLYRFYDAIVEEAGTGLDALDRLGENSGFDLILMDIWMPGMNGLEACEAMRARGINIRIVLMSAYCDTEKRARAHSLGVTLLNKPFDRDALARLLLECGGDESE